MKQLATIGFIFLSLALVGQKPFDKKKFFQASAYDTICLAEMTYLNLKLETTKAEMYHLLGKPDKIVMPKYDCGGFSDDWQGVIFKQYFYNTLNFIGTDKYLVIEKIDFKASPSTTILYKGVKLNSKTKLETFAKLFPKSFQKIGTKKNGISLLYLRPSLISEDYVILKFENGLLSKLEYYSPC